MSENEISGQKSTKAPFLSNAWYDHITWLVRYGLPGIGTLYFTLAQIWGLPAGEQVVGTITAVALFLGVVLGVSSRQYRDSDERIDGALVVDTSDPEKDVYRLDLVTELEALPGKDEIILKVQGTR